ncbi:MAG: YkvA family protein [Syntrophomonadaceae bacterium]
MEDQNYDFYQSIRNKINSWMQTEEGRNNPWADYILAVPDIFHLLVKLTLDPAVPDNHKAKLGLGLAYFISPIDLLPESLLGPLGLVDDLVVAAYILNTMINETDPELVRKHWAGDQDVLRLVQQIIDSADEMIGSRIIDKIKAMFPK